MTLEFAALDSSFDVEFGVKATKRVSIDQLSIAAGRRHMTLVEELTKLANDYVSGGVTLAELAGWLNDRLTMYADMADDDPAAGLWGFIQVRIYQSDDGFLPEDIIRQEVRDYLAAEGLLTPAARSRAAG